MVYLGRHLNLHDDVLMEFRELAVPNEANIGRRVEAIVELDSAAKVVSQRLSWDERERQVWFR